MNIPNMLTVMRVLLVPAIVAVHYTKLSEKVSPITDNVTLAAFVILIIFIIAAITDFLDGFIARKYKMVTDFGKFMDPLADKLLVLACLVILLDMNLLPAFVVIIILSREFIVTGIRLIAANEGKVIAASVLGKVKTISQFIMIIVLFLNNYPFSEIGDGGLPIDTILIWIATGFTLLSGIEYIYKNRQYISQMK